MQPPSTRSHEQPARRPLLDCGSAASYLGVAERFMRRLVAERLKGSDSTILVVVRGISASGKVVGAGIKLWTVSEPGLRPDFGGSGFDVKRSPGRGSASRHAGVTCHTEALSGADSGSATVLVDETTQDIGALDRPIAIGVAVLVGGRWWCWEVKVQATVRSSSVVVGQVRVQNLP
jgi:hypothetical protein